MRPCAHAGSLLYWLAALAALPAITSSFCNATATYSSHSRELEIVRRARMQVYLPTSASQKPLQFALWRPKFLQRVLGLQAKGMH
jgi:hypothetical protein